MSEREIFLGAIDVPDPATRAAYLDGACRGDAHCASESSRCSGPTKGPGVSSLCRRSRHRGRTIQPRARLTNRTSLPAPTRRAHGPGAGADEALGFLGPSQRPDALVRLWHYEVLEVLGRGGFGTVFSAYDDVHQLVFAVKVLAPSMAATSPARKRFLRDARSAAPIRHENVVRIHEIEELPLPYLVMEFVPGPTLQQILDRTGPLEVAEALRIGRQIAEGLAAAHRAGLIHRDIKPSNVLIESGPQGRVKITDFGLARAVDDASLTRSGIVAGTPLYMAPEQARGEALDHRADLFSLGTVLYAVLTGRPPFRAETALAVLKRVAEDDPPRSARSFPRCRSGSVASSKSCTPRTRVTGSRARKTWRTY